jgi:4-hydroxybutyrate CoA-transferase
MAGNEYRTKIRPAQEAVSLIRSGMRLTIPLCCGLPQVLMSALIEQKDRIRDVEIVSGLQIKYPFLADGLQESFTYRTWQCAPPIRQLIPKGTVKYIPMRQGDALKTFGRDGIWPIDAALIQVSPPDREGNMSLGVSIGHTLPLAEQAGLVIAEINERMPRVFGDTSINISQVDAIVESEMPLLEYPSRHQGTDTEKAIGDLVATLIPDGAYLQIGIGSIPEAVLAALKGKKGIGFFGMGVDGIVNLYESGALEPIDKRKDSLPRVLITETLGTERIFNFIHENKLVEGYPIQRIINPWEASKIERFISIISAIEIDIFGQANLETVGGSQISAVGGSFDFVEGAHFSAQGKSIIAMTAASPDGKHSRIVSDLPRGSVVTIPRHCVNYVVTEFGVANLYGKSLAERAKCLISVAHPDFRKELKDAVKGKQVGL